MDQVNLDAITNPRLRQRVARIRHGRRERTSATRADALDTIRDALKQATGTDGMLIRWAFGVKV